MNLETFQSELTTLGGLTLTGQPILKVVRGEDELKFACGRMIPKYNVPSGAVKVTEKKFRLRHIFTGEVKPCTFDEAKVVWEQSQKYDLTNHWIAETCRVTQITVTAKEGYFIEQWIPPERIKDTPETWEANRYRMWLDEERGEEVLTDMIGPFPSEGQYDNFLSVERLDFDALDAVRRAWHNRNQWESRSAQLLVSDAFAEAQERERQHEALVAGMLKSEMAPHAFRGLYLSNGDPRKMNKKTKYGRAK